MKSTMCSGLLIYIACGTLLLHSASASPNAHSQESLPTVDLGYSKYQGIFFSDALSETTNTNFLGMRYAAPPTNSLRFMPPRTPESTQGVQLASVQPNRCWAGNTGAQPSSPFKGSEVPVKRGEHDRRAPPVSIPPFDEDCLFLDVYIPGKVGEKKNIPVVVWIHGGGYASGSVSGFSGTDIYDGNDLIREANGNVVVVTIQYRLGLFGFLAGQNVKNGGVLNAGLLDQQFALQWVQKHISQFGGDAGKVTIWGQSAGAGSVLLQLVANGGATRPPLFHAAITSSTFLPSLYPFNDRIPETLYQDVVSQTNCTTGAKDTLTCLRQAPIDALQAANSNISASAFFGTYAFVPVVDGTFITERPTQLLKKGKVNRIRSLYSVTNTFEGALFVDQTTANTLQIPQFVSQLFPKFGVKEIEASALQYASLGSNIFQAVAIMGESIFICPTYYLASALKGASLKGEFAIPPGGHGNDLAYYFPTTMNANGVPPYSNPQFDASFAESYLKFAMSLNPNVKFDLNDITPHWDVWKGSNEMLFNSTDTGAPDIRQIKTSAALLERCAFWESVSALTGQ